MRTHQKTKMPWTPTLRCWTRPQLIYTPPHTPCGVPHTHRHQIMPPQPHPRPNPPPSPFTPPGILPSHPRSSRNHTANHTSNHTPSPHTPRAAIPTPQSPTPTHINAPTASSPQPPPLQPLVTSHQTQHTSTRAPRRLARCRVRR